MSSSGVSRVLRVGTPSAGFALVNGTPTIVTLTAPNDGREHVCIMTFFIVVTVAEVGGQLNLLGTQGGVGFNSGVDLGGHAPGNVSSAASTFTVDPNTAVTLQQASALTGGAATVFAAIAIL